MNRITITENRQNGIRIDGFVTNSQLDKLEILQSYGGFKRFSINLWDTVANKSNYKAIKTIIYRDIIGKEL